MRRTSAWAFVCALLAGAAAPGGWLGPRPALADAETLTGKAAVLAAPDPSAAALGIYDPGTVVSVDGPPQGAYYPVSIDGVSGWVPGALLSAPQDGAASGPVSTSSAGGASGEGSAPRPAPKDRSSKKSDRNANDATPPVDATAATAAAQDAPSAEPTAADEPTQSADAAPTATDPAANDGSVATALPATTADPTAEPATAAATETALSAPTQTPATDGGATPTATTGDGTEAMDAAATTATAVPEAAAEPAATDAAATAVSAATPSPTDASTATREPTVASTPSPAPTSSLDLNGDASVTTDVDLKSDANDGSDTVFRVPAGSTVHLTGQAQNGYVSAEFMWMYGWLPRWSVAPAVAVAAEMATPDPNVDVKTPKAGSGVAFTTSNLTMRAGPSANDDAVTTVPAGSKVTLTGVWQNGFQRVTYGDQVGWVSNDYLQNPVDPTPATKPNGKPQYSHDQIVKIIYAAADRYGQSRDAMLRVATCESNLDPYAVNPSGSYGLFQFIRSTWQSTPYGNQDIFDPKANANAAGWMWQQGRQDEWVCK